MRDTPAPAIAAIQLLESYFLKRPKMVVKAAIAIAGFGGISLFT